MSGYGSKYLNVYFKIRAYCFFFFFFFFLIILLYNTFLTFTILTIQYNIDMPIEDYVRNYLVRLITKNYSTLGNI